MKKQCIRLYGHLQSIFTNNRFLFVAACIFLLCVCVAQPQKCRAVDDETCFLQDITISETKSGFVVDILTDRPADAYHLAYFSSPNRMVIDFPGVWEFPGDTVLDRQNDVVAKIVVGEHPDMLRITLHLKGRRIPDPDIIWTSTGISLNIRR